MNLWQPPQYGPLRPQDFRCSLCGNIYEKGMTEEEALAELARLWPGVPVEECDVCCDDCHLAMMPERRN